jgi:DNA-directed RNA polymerase subunit RPC12/RpoP
MAKEIWFKCIKCGREAYCDIYFEKIPKAEVMCPFCLERMKLKDARVQ